MALADQIVVRWTDKLRERTDVDPVLRKALEQSLATHGGSIDRRTLAAALEAALAAENQ